MESSPYVGHQATWRGFYTPKDSRNGQTCSSLTGRTSGLPTFSYCRSRAREQAYTRDLISLWPGELSRSPYDLAFLNEFQDRLEAALAEVPPMYREVLLLVGFEGLRPADAAGVCGITPEALRQRLSRARALLSQRLKDKEPSHEMVPKQVSL